MLLLSIDWWVWALFLILFLILFLVFLADTMLPAPVGLSTL